MKMTLRLIQEMISPDYTSIVDNTLETINTSKYELRGVFVSPDLWLVLFSAIIGGSRAEVVDESTYKFN